MNKSPKYITSFNTPELSVIQDRWGAQSSSTLLPFQVKAIQIKGDTQSYYNGISQDKINSLNEHEESDLRHVDVNKAGLGINKYNLYFYPNPIITSFGKRHRTHFKGSPLIFNDEVAEKDRTYIAAICFVAIDVDFNDTPESVLTKRLKQLPLQPSTIVHSGNGLHIYFSVKHVYLVSKALDYTGQLYKIQTYENTLRAVSQKISDILGGDSRANNHISGLLRIPNTWNYKIKDGAPNITYCKYLKGNLIEDYHNPKYSLDEIIEKFSIDLTTSNPTPPNYKYEIDKRPTPCDEGWMIASNLFWGYFSDFKAPKPFQKNITRYFKYVYGHRKLDYYIELREPGTDRTAGMKRITLKKVRAFFLENKLIEELEAGSYKKRKATHYKPTDLFYEIIKMPKPIYKSQRKISEIVNAEIIEGQSRKQIPKEIGILKASGFSKDKIKDIMLKKIAARKVIKGDEKDLVEWCLKTYF